MSTDTNVPTSIPLELEEHTTRKKAVSISSCDSDPLAYRHVGGGSSRASSVSGHSSFFDGSASGYASSSDNEYERNVGDQQEPGPETIGNSELANLPGLRHGSVSQGVASTLKGTAKATAKKRVDVDEADMEEFILRKKREADAATEADNANAAPNANVPPGATPSSGGLAVIPKSDISATPFAVVESVIPRSSTIVAAHTQRGSVVDCGARVCLADGTVVGTITTLLGAVLQCRYAIVGESGSFAELLASGKAAEDRYNAAIDQKKQLTSEGLGDAPATNSMSTPHAPVSQEGDEDSDMDEVVHAKFLAQTPLAIGTPLYFETTNAIIIFDPMAVAAAQKEATDASFVEDDELPDTKRPDFSDDEKEREWKRRRKAERQQGGAAMPGTSNTTSLGGRTNNKDTFIDDDNVLPLGSSAKPGGDVESDVSSSGSEAEFDDEGNMLSYKPKSKKAGGNARKETNIAQPTPNQNSQPLHLKGYNATQPGPSPQPHLGQNPPQPPTAPTPVPLASANSVLPPGELSIRVGGVLVRGRAAVAAVAPRPMDSQVSGYYAKPAVASQRPPTTSNRATTPQNKPTESTSIKYPHPMVAADPADAIGWGTEEPVANPYPYPQSTSERDTKRHRPEVPPPPAPAPNKPNPPQRANPPPPPPTPPTPTSAPPPPQQPTLVQTTPSMPIMQPQGFMGNFMPPSGGLGGLGAGAGASMGGLDAATVAILMSNPQLLQGLAQQQQQLMLMAQMMVTNGGTGVANGFPSLLGQPIMGQMPPLATMPGLTAPTAPANNSNAAVVPPPPMPPTNGAPQ